MFRVVTNALDTRQAMYSITLRRVLAAIFAVEKRVFVAVGIQLEMRVRHIVICGRPGLQHFSTLSNKRHDFKKKLLNIKCVT